MTSQLLHSRALSGYGFAKKRRPLTDVVQHVPKFLYHDLVYGYHDDEIIGYGSSAFSQIPGYNTYNFADREAYVNEVLTNRDLAHTAFGPLASPERGIVSFPFRGMLQKSRIHWEQVPSESLHALQEAASADLVLDRGDTYTLTKSGWLFYVNLMYYFMPSAGQRWLSNEIERQLRSGKDCGDTDLASLLDATW